MLGFPISAPTKKPNISFLVKTMSTEELSENEKSLNAINDTLLNRATPDQSAYMIGTRRLDRIPIPELLKMQAKFITAGA